MVDSGGSSDPVTAVSKFKPTCCPVLCIFTDWMSGKITLNAGSSTVYPICTDRTINIETRIDRH